MAANWQLKQDKIDAAKKLNIHFGDLACCLNCKFSTINDDIMVLECRYNPRDRHGWSSVQNMDWCGKMKYEDE